ncbi:MAG: helix-turn-helix transcriptional regulator [Clostridia bacterium]|nr:helix-turn-helix transcriptional regulator [Bacilli bacterium]MBR6689374.1 helix-turn-helix transcriptional regulator [Clostridia bacterium]
MKFNEKMIMLRKQHNLSQEKVAEKLKVARQTVSKWELGETTPEMDKLIMISELYNITLDELVKEENQEKIVNDPNNTNSQKLAGMTIKILKGIGIFIIILVILYVFLMIIGLIAFNSFKIENDSTTVIQTQEEVEVYEE